MELQNRRAERLRRVIVVVTMIVTLLYLWWRIDETLNPEALVFSWALWAAEAFSALTAFLFFFTVWKPARREPAPPGSPRTVDVLVTTKSESVSVLRMTLIACRDMRVPHRTLVLDDGGRPEVKALCDEIGCEYLARPTHEHAKAGNLNYGLQHTKAELVALFDADHVPLPHFLERLLGYFDDDRIAYVQAPHEFRNIDSFQHRVDPEKKRIWAEQYFFFSLIQPGRDHWNAAYFVGSCAVLRRRALDDIGGFAVKSVTEDLLTSLLLHAKGWSSVYFDEPLAYGLAAETFLPFHVQRRRWGIGAWQVFFKANPLLMRGLTMPQRLCYLGSIIYPFEGLQKLVFYLTPPAALLTGVLPMRALDIDYLLHFIPYYALSVFAFNEMGRGFGGTLMLEQFSMGKFAIYIESLFAFLLKGWSAEFKVTPKGRHGRTPPSLVVPQVAITVLSLAAVAWGLAALLFGRRHDEFVVAINCLWALYNSGLGLAIIQIDRHKSQERREEFRIPDTAPVRYRTVGSPAAEARYGVAQDLTAQGAHLLAMDDVPVGAEVELDIALPNRMVRALGTVVRRREASDLSSDMTSAGIHFHDVVPGQGDSLGRYLHYAAVRKFMGEFSERRSTCLPAVVIRADGSRSYGVIRNVSKSGALVLSREAAVPGDTFTIETHLGDEVVVIRGEAVRSRPYESPEFPEYLVGLRFDEAGRTAIDRVLEVVEKLRERFGG